jgi:uncharacterized protein YndB with AHSA1/START domain
MSPISVHNDTIVQEVTIKAPAERIFAALTKPAELLKWWSSPGKFKIVHAECDLQPGGKWILRVARDSGSDACATMVSGEYRTIEPPRLLTYTWIRENENYPETLVRWDLDEKDGFTTVRVTHSGLITEELRRRNDGWPLIVELLKNYIDVQR